MEKVGKSGAKSPIYRNLISYVVVAIAFVFMSGLAITATNHLTQKLQTRRREL